MLNKTISTLALALTLTGCQSMEAVTAARAQEEAAIKNAPEATVEVAQRIIEQYAPINTSPDFTAAQGSVGNPVYNSIAKQQSQLAERTQFVRETITLTKDMYDGDLKGFLIPASTLRLDTVGNPSDFDVSIVVTDNLHQNPKNNDMDYAEFSEAAMKTIAVAELSSPENADQQNSNSKELGYLYAIDNGEYHTLHMPLAPTFEFFTGDKKANVAFITRLMNAENYRRYNDYKFFIKAEGAEAKAMVGQDVEAVFMVKAAFKVNKTNQYILVGSDTHSLIRDKQGKVLNGRISINYHFPKWQEELFLKPEHEINTVTYLK